LGTKISALILTGPIFLSLLFCVIKHKKISKVLYASITFILYTSILALIFSPYNLINKNIFLSSMDYEISVATGSIKVFYTNQFLNSVPYLFQMIHVFPYVNGIFVYVFSLIGLVIFFLKKKYKNPYWLLLLIPSFVYFLYNGQLYTKWTRFMSPIFFIFPLMASLLISQIKNKTINLLLFLISIIPGIFYLNLYLSNDIRVFASQWATKKLLNNSTILSESGNVINLPIKNYSFEVYNFDFYQLDTNPVFQSELPQLINNSNYIFIPSRRVFKNQNNSFFPFSNRYYQNLFSGNLGFTLLKQFNPSADLFLNSEDAEETWSVFDHPTIRIYEKKQKYDLRYYQNLLYETSNPL
jgi:hypothetical protein